MNSDANHKAEESLSDAPHIDGSVEQWRHYIENVDIEKVKALRKRVKGIEYLIKISRRPEEIKEEQY